MRKFYLYLILWMPFMSAFAAPVISNGILTSWGDASGSIIIPSTVTSIGGSAFQYNANITSVTVPNSVTSIGSMAFYYCTNLKTVVIGDSTNTGYQPAIMIQNSAFFGCSHITTLSLNLPLAPYYYPFQNLSSLTTLTIGNAVTSIDNLTFTNSTGLTTVTLGREGLAPASMAISMSAFNNCPNLVTLNLNSNMQILNYYSNAISPFPAITTVSIGNKVTSIEDYAFSGCAQLKNIVVPNSVDSIGQSVFSGCKSLASVTFGSSVVSIGANVFSDCGSLMNINVDNANASFSSVNGVLLSKDQLTFIQYPEGRTGAYEVPASVKTIGSKAFISCTGLQSVVMPQTITSIQSSAFANCTGLDSIAIPQSITSIHSSAFANCSGLTSVTIGQADSTSTANVSIASDAFSGCGAITKLSLNKNF